MILVSFGLTNINAQVHAGFSATPTSGCTPITVVFKDLSTGGATSWKWDLGNGTQSSLQNPSVTYFTPGSYTVKLVATNSSGNDVVTKTNYITVFANPTAAFAVSPVSGCYPLSVAFADQSNPGTGNILNWQWDFGDGTISNLQTPAHIYQNTGVFNVTLTVKNSNGCSNTLTKTNLISINEGVHANFTNSSPPSCTVPVVVDFVNQSTGNNINGYVWDFGDGQTSTALNPSHTYTSAGTYTVSLKVTNVSGCSDIIVKQKQVYIGVAHADFTMPANVCTGVAFAISNASLPTNGLQHINWTFSDGTADTVVNPQKTFATPGVYTVTQNVDYGGCSDATSKTITVVPRPTPTFTTNVTAACQAPLTVVFTNTSVDGGVVSWDFGDGTTSKLASPSHTYTKLGDYTVKLVVINTTGCTSTLSIPAAIHIGPSKIMQIVGAPFKGCIPYTANFSAVMNPVLPGATYLWDFGDGTTSTLPNPLHLYANEGAYDLRLIVTTAGGCSDTLAVPSGVVVGNRPTAAFVADPLIACPNDTVHFTSLATIGVDKFLWYFGDGDTSALENPAHAYGDTGLNTVQFIVTRFGCSDTAIKFNYLYIKPPIAIFKDSVLCSNQYQHYFIDHSLGAVFYRWDFGDGGSSTLPSPSHLYADTGQYKVTLFVSDSNCHHKRETPIYVLNEHAAFSATDSIGCASITKSFLSTSNQKYIASYLWNFGDGSGEYDTLFATASHRYGAVGNYQVALKTVDRNNCPDSISKPVLVKKYGPMADFASLAHACVNTSISFKDSSKGDGLNKIVDWIWDFGDSTGLHSFTALPFTHTYTKKGDYDVVLTVIDAIGCSDTLSQLGAVGVNGPTANFDALDTVLCQNTGVGLRNLSSGKIVSYLWNLGDGSTSTAYVPSHSYSALGLYNIKLAVVDSFGCTDSLSKLKYINVSRSKALFSMSDSFTHCPPLFVSFTNSSVNLAQANWDFGDGNTSTLLNPSHTYTISGVFNIKLLVTGVGGCTDTLVKKVVIQGPSGTFTYGPIQGCSPLLVNFSSKALNTDTYTWDFDDGATSFGTTNTGSHLYTLIGDYLPKIILADSSGCKIPIYGADTVRVKKIVSHIEQLTTYLICDSAFVSFTDSSVTNDAITSYVWSFGDGQTSALQNPVHHYNTNGLYYVNYKVVTSYGCTSSDTLQVPIKVVPSPQIMLTAPNPICQSSKVQFAAQLQNPDTSTIKWHWDFGNGQTAVVQAVPIQTYTGLGPYHISVMAINGSGCSDTVNDILTVWPTPVVDAGPNKFICLGKSDSLLASGAKIYLWDTQPSLSCINCYNPVATPTASQLYKVSGTDIHGCVATDSVLVQVKLPTQVKVSLGDTLCVGQSYRLGASGAESYIWSPTQTLSASNIAAPLATPLVSTTYRVIGYDTIGCFQDTGYAFIKVYPIPTVNVVEERITIGVGSSVTLHGTASADVTNLHWTPAIWLSCTGCAEPVATPKDKVTYTLTATNAGGCTAQDKVDILVLCGNGNIYVPNTFSPNGDGANDVFYPRGKGLYNIKGMRIFSRWGQLLFEKANFAPNEAGSGWDGTFKGEKLTPDVYVYLIEVVCENNEIYNLKGNVTLLR